MVYFFFVNLFSMCRELKNLIESQNISLARKYGKTQNTTYFQALQCTNDGTYAKATTIKILLQNCECVWDIRNVNENELYDELQKKINRQIGMVVSQNNSDNNKNNDNNNETAKTKNKISYINNHNNKNLGDLQNALEICESKTLVIQNETYSNNNTNDNYQPIETENITHNENNNSHNDNNTENLEHQITNTSISNQQNLQQPPQSEITATKIPPTTHLPVFVFFSFICRVYGYVTMFFFFCCVSRRGPW